MLADLRPQLRIFARLFLVNKLPVFEPVGFKHRERFEVFSSLFRMFHIVGKISEPDAVRHGIYLIVSDPRFFCFVCDPIEQFVGFLEPGFFFAGSVSTRMRSRYKQACSSSASISLAFPGQFRERDVNSIMRLVQIFFTGLKALRGEGRSPRRFCQRQIA